MGCFVPSTSSLDPATHRSRVNFVHRPRLGMTRPSSSFSDCREGGWKRKMSSWALPVKIGRGQACRNARAVPRYSVLELPPAFEHAGRESVEYLYRWYTSDCKFSKTLVSRVIYFIMRSLVPLTSSLEIKATIRDSQEIYSRSIISCSSKYISIGTY